MVVTDLWQNGIDSYLCKSLISGQVSSFRLSGQNFSGIFFWVVLLAGTLVVVIPFVYIGRVSNAYLLPKINQNVSLHIGIGISFLFLLIFYYFKLVS